MGEYDIEELLKRTLAARSSRTKSDRWDSIDESIRVSIENKVNDALKNFNTNNKYGSQFKTGQGKAATAKAERLKKENDIVTHMKQPDKDEVLSEMMESCGNKAKMLLFYKKYNGSESPFNKHLSEVVMREIKRMK